MIVLADVKVGDKIGVCHGGWDSVCELKTVARKTATQLVLDDGTRWTTRGRKVGEAASYHGSYLVDEADALERIADLREKRERMALTRQIRDAAYPKMTLEALRAIAAEVSRHEPQSGEQK